MIVEFLNKDYDTILLTMIVVSFAWLSVFIAMGVDLFFGIKKAKQLGEATTSEGLRRTINKATYYFALLTFALLFDAFNVITSYFFPKPFDIIPYFTVLVALGQIYSEGKSVREKAEDKLRRKTDQSYKELIKLISERQELVNTALEIMKEKALENNEKN